MKGVKKYLFLMAVVAALFGFVACSSDDGGASEVAVYTRPTYMLYDDVSCAETLTLYDNGTFETVAIVKGTTDKGATTVDEEYIIATGTYEGDVTKDTGDGNDVTAAIEKLADFDKDTKKFILFNIEDYVKHEIEETYSAAGSNLDEYLDKYFEEYMKYYKTTVVRIKDGELTIYGLSGTYIKKN